MELNFPPKEGSGITKLIPHALDDCMDLIMKLLAYNPEDRLSARQVPLKSISLCANTPPQTCTRFSRATRYPERRQMC